MPDRWFVALVSMYVSQYNCCLIDNCCAEACVLTSASGEEIWPGVDQKISMSFMQMILGIHEKCSWDRDNIAIKNLIQNNMHIISFKIKSLLLQYLDHSNKFVYSHRQFCVQALHYVIVAEHTTINNTWL